MSIALTQFAFRKKTSLPWLLLALACMLASAYCFFGWMSAAGRISGWIGLPQYASQIPRLESQARLWSAMAIALPFVAALLLSIGKRAAGVQRGTDSAASLSYPAQPATEKWLAPILQYLGQLVISLIGTLGFVVGLFLLGLFLHKLGIRQG
jgi:hypothetical protein